MKAFILYNLATETTAAALDLAKRIEAEQVEVEILDADSPRGSAMAESYDVLGRPAVLLARSDGSVTQIWQGVDGLPTPSDVAYLAHQ